MSFLSNLEWRYATQRFNGVDVPGDQVTKIFDAIRMAPTSFGLQPFHVSVITNAELKEKMKEKAWGQEQITTASHILVFSIHTNIPQRIEGYFNILSGGDEQTRAGFSKYEDSMKKTFSSMDEKSLKTWATHQTYVALGFALAACAELNVDSCPIEGFESKEYIDILNLSDGLHPVVLLSIGFRDVDDKVRPKIRFGAEDLFTLN